MPRPDSSALAQEPRAKPQLLGPSKAPAPALFGAPSELAFSTFHFGVRVQPQRSAGASITDTVKAPRPPACASIVVHALGFSSPKLGHLGLYTACQLRKIGLPHSPSLSVPFWLLPLLLLPAAPTLPSSCCLVVLLCSPPQHGMCSLGSTDMPSCLLPACPRACEIPVVAL